MVAEGNQIVRLKGPKKECIEMFFHWNWPKSPDSTVPDKVISAFKEAEKEIKLIMELPYGIAGTHEKRASNIRVYLDKHPGSLKYVKSEHVDYEWFHKSNGIRRARHVVYPLVALEVGGVIIKRIYIDEIVKAMINDLPIPKVPMMPFPIAPIVSPP